MTLVDQIIFALKKMILDMTPPGYIPAEFLNEIMEEVIENLNKEK